MLFLPQTIYHIYNQGNNRQPIFFTHANYLYFLRKMRTYLLPHVDFLAYCLMPNHFHWLVYARESACAWLDLTKDPKKPVPPRQQLSHQINIALRTYTRAINHQEHRTGSLFRQHTKGKDVGIQLLKTGRNKRTDLYFPDPDSNYGWNCFHYLHNNPPEAGLVKIATEWPYSSASDYAGLRNGTLCNQGLAKRLLGL
jgi:putative transposase